MTTKTSHYTGEERSKRIFAIVGASTGNLVEWLSDNPTVQLANTAGVFAAGFLMRPIGGWLFGRVADKHGRKSSMMISVLMMCAGSLVIAFLPTYKDIGAWAPALLLMARLFQGLSVGGEYGATATYMSEVALKGQRGFFASFQYVTLIGGQLLAVLVLVVLQQLLSEEELRAWGWRIPFVIGAIAAVISFLTVLGYTAGGSLIFYTFTTYMQKYLVNTAGMHAKTASYIMTGALFVYMCMQPLFGMLSDRIGRRNSMLWFGALGTLCTVPILLTLKTVTSPFLAFVLIALALAIVSFYTSISGLVKAEMFPPHVRALGVGLAYAVANAIFGGSAEYVALGLKSMGMENTFYWYVTGMMAVAFLFSLRLPKQAEYLHHDL
ncbi:alpha-ketoglutarate permease [Pseudomonas sp. ABAC21]|nr:alpha-ketoglutarate permease [Pseudomonas sp. ABAC21]